MKRLNSWCWLDFPFTYIFFIFFEQVGFFCREFGGIWVVLKPISLCRYFMHRNQGILKAFCRKPQQLQDTTPSGSEGAVIVHCVDLQTKGFPTRAGTMAHNEWHPSFLSLVWVMQMWDSKSPFPGWIRGESTQPSGLILTMRGWIMQGWEEEQ